MIGRKPRRRPRPSQRTREKFRQIRAEQFEVQQGKCCYCEQRMSLNPDDFRKPIAATCDHKLSFADGGSNAISNIVIACRNCNNLKGQIDYDVFVAEKLWLPENKLKLEMITTIRIGGNAEIFKRLDSRFCFGSCMENR